MKNTHRLGAAAASAALTSGLILAATPAQAQTTDPSVDTSTTKDCMRGFKPGQWIDGMPPQKGSRGHILGNRDRYQTGDGYILNMTIMFDGYAEGWYVVVDSGVPGKFDSRGRGAMLRWCEKYEQPKKPQPKPSTGSGGGRASIGGTGGTIVMGTVTVDEPRWGTVGTATQVR